MTLTRLEIKCPKCGHVFSSKGCLLMNDERKTKSQLIKELQKTRRAHRKAEKALQGNTDLAEFRRSIRAFRESEEQYRTMVDHLSEGIICPEPYSGATDYISKVP
jgi:hypothetical protein